MGGAELSGLQPGISLRRCGNLLSCGSRFVMSGAFIFFPSFSVGGEKGTVRFPAGGGGGKGKRVEKGAVVEDWEGLLTWVVFLKKRRTFFTGRAAGETSVQLGIAGIGKTGGLFFFACFFRPKANVPHTKTHPTLQPSPPLAIRCLRMQIRMYGGTSPWGRSLHVQCPPSSGPIRLPQRLCVCFLPSYVHIYFSGTRCCRPNAGGCREPRRRQRGGQPGSPKSRHFGGEEGNGGRLGRAQAREEGIRSWGWNPWGPLLPSP